jgi:hypothetical protein
MQETQQYSKPMNIILWCTQVLLAITFIWSASMKLFNPEALPWLWIKENPGLAKLTGVFDLLAGLGLVLPALLRIQPKLTIYAAYGTIALMVSACVFHISRGEASQIGFNVFVIVAAVFIAWGRKNKAPIVSKNS